MDLWPLVVMHAQLIAGHMKSVCRAYGKNSSNTLSFDEQASYINKS